MNITKDEYLKALAIVETYHNQIFRYANFVRQSSIIQPSLIDFLQNCKNLPAYIERILAEYIRIYGDIPLNNVVKAEFIRFRNAGKKSWMLFNELRNEYISRHCSTKSSLLSHSHFCFQEVDEEIKQLEKEFEEL